MLQSSPVPELQQPNAPELQQPTAPKLQLYPVHDLTYSQTPELSFIPVLQKLTKSDLQLLPILELRPSPELLMYQSTVPVLQLLPVPML